MTRERLEATIASLALELSGAQRAHVDPQVPFALLGLDSLRTIELAAAIEKATGLDLPPEIVADCGNARALAARLREMSEQSADERLQPDDPFALMLADSVAPPEAPISAPRGFSPASQGLLDARSILLTGATGFLGRWIAKELLDRGPAMLVCLVRPGTGNAEARLAGSLARANITPAQMAGRVKVVEGDLSLPNLGLTRKPFDELAAEIDAICHAGASVNWIHSYSSLRASNVLGTAELLRLASRHGRPFHFVSSVSVCYSTSAPPQVDEQFDALPHIRGVHLGYAQTKAIAEALVRQAGQRGLPVNIYRPALIGGHSEHHDFNADDLLSLLVRGCVRMGAAPDLDWTLDILPVECVARRIIALSHSRGTFHLIHPRPRHWRECVLWMRLYGYPLKLVPYAAWLRQLECDVETATAGGARHPLAPLCRFFGDRPDGAEGLTLPQLYEDVRRTRALSEGTDRHLDDDARRSAELDASLLDHYFRSLRSAGELDAPRAVIGALAGSENPRARSDQLFDADFFSRAVGDRLDTIASASLLSRGSEHSIVSDLTAWRSNRPTGLFQYRLHVSGSPRETAHDVVLKVKPRDRDVMAVGEALARVCDERVGAAYARWQERTGFVRSHIREIEIYRQRDARFTRHLPALLGSIVDEHHGIWAMVLERVSDVTHLDSACSQHRWSREAIDAAITGLAALQATWYGREAELRSLDWIGFERTSTSMSEMSDLWEALAAHARSTFCAWADPTISSIHRRLIASAGKWWAALESAPRTLIHNDFNPRNICLRRTSSGPLLCAYDWELATLGPPQRDLAELLCFVLSHEADRNQVDRWIQHHRRALERETGCAIDRDDWIEGFRSSLYDVLVDRLSMYALIHRVRRQAFLPRVVQTWRHLYRLFPLPEDA